MVTSADEPGSADTLCNAGASPRGPTLHVTRLPASPLVLSVIENWTAVHSPRLMVMVLTSNPPFRRLSQG
jgi:hypothetical protein